MATNRPPSGRHSVPAVTATARRRPSSPEIAPAAPKNSGKCQPFLFLPAVLDRCSAPSSGRRSPPATTAITGRQPLPPPFTSGRHLHNSPPASAAFRRHQQRQQPGGGAVTSSSAYSRPLRSPCDSLVSGTMPCQGGRTLPLPPYASAPCGSS